ncbi:MAG: hypothetical protein UR25_C0002G0034 [Candidatus Nomurabacteria bacterium GW2011_GWE1_32_28]|uniref:Uncharacterized protein n=1 Tax=Candidatus Nomurabacteria bacterium GW2011_GWF1_31_48 TaxID=1618767 RepID=A0A0F9YGD4_9BACT|nr:MAG: hypothetical protein UR10_C0002G0034 [Candidatus Nomurabacteria bacterium GW2011_GWF2_30_133]KKP29077.1 MAG: hypothetical protein UR18_C0001G0198 [Candidatus Nomurabacteria bacterium GW2011_GWE2_31_40]KKP30513.1 MAG: hypothetical protein UR19_C0002G0034 [Candidatus Nomurabacteria bacterium GW2011_GWF1_31_48]KKP34998.1 MAG: hypothetical protein UR25_C0002G0034 [Candidatus Nomurabacteria bacterium GW2011_GWE1_32_28]HAS80634.1 hypothetical protein [Candidatus Nomurabacteria bacterium]
MYNDEKLKNIETSFRNEEEQSNMDNFLSFEYVNNIFLLENEMLLSIDSYLDKETKNIIIYKISKENKILLEITNKEICNKKRIENETKNVIDINYFNKKPLSINNI